MTEAPEIGTNLSNRVVVVTGASGGIGKAIAAHLRRMRAVVVATDLAADESQDILAHDVRSEADWIRIAQQAEALHGGIDGLVNNAGIVNNQSLQDCTEATYRAIIDVNQIGVFLGMRVLADFISRRGGGSMVNISSAAGLVGTASTFAYGASKFAVTGMTKCAALDLGGMGIRVNSIHPGAIETPMMEAAPAEYREAVVKATSALPAGRPGRPEEIAHLAAFLLSDLSSYSTGASFVADGGWTVA